jgi:hypothetical protein
VKRLKKWLISFSLATRGGVICILAQEWIKNVVSTICRARRADEEKPLCFDVAKLVWSEFGVVGLGFHISLLENFGEYKFGSNFEVLYKVIQSGRQEMVSVSYFRGGGGGVAV